eukprot:3130463-Rhodomonas_salina.1
MRPGQYQRAPVRHACVARYARGDTIRADHSFSGRMLRRRSIAGPGFEGVSSSTTSDCVMFFSWYKQTPLQYRLAPYPTFRSNMQYRTRGRAGVGWYRESAEDRGVGHDGVEVDGVRGVSARTLHVIQHMLPL